MCQALPEGFSERGSRLGFVGQGVLPPLFCFMVLAGFCGFARHTWTEEEREGAPITPKLRFKRFLPDARKKPELGLRYIV